MSTFLNAHNGWKDRNDKMLFRSNQIWFYREIVFEKKIVLWRSQFFKIKIPQVLDWDNYLLLVFPLPVINMFSCLCFKDDGDDEEDLCIVYYSVASVHVCYSCLHILLFTTAHLPVIISIIIIIIIFIIIIINIIILSIIIITTAALSSSSSSPLSSL